MSRSSDEEEEYEVQAILAHKVDKHNRISYRVRWVGYGSEHDTWQKEHTLANATERISEYWNKVPGGRKGLVQEREKGRPRSDTDWQSEVRQVEGIEAIPESKSYRVFLQWRDGRQTVASKEEVRQKCPLKLLDYFDQHLIYKETA